MSGIIDPQAKNITHLLELVAQNPELPIVPFVDAECIESEDYNRWIASWGKPRIDHIWGDGERIYVKSEDFDDLVEKELDKLECDVVADAEAKVEAYPWEKVIVVEIEPL